MLAVVFRGSQHGVGVERVRRHGVGENRGVLERVQTGEDKMSRIKKTLRGGEDKMSRFKFLEGSEVIKELHMNTTDGNREYNGWKP